MGRGSAPFWARSVRRRPAAAVVLALLALVATVVSVIAPLLLRAVEQSTLDDALAHAGVRGTSIAASAEIEYQKLSEAQGAVVTTTSAATESRLWHGEVVVAESKALVSYRAPSDPADADVRYTQLAGLSDDCASLGLVDGRCPSGSDEVLAPAGSGIATGAVLPLSVLDVPEQSVRVRVVGTYDATSRVGRIASAPGKLFGSGGTGGPDLVMSLAGFDDLSITGTMWSVKTLRHGLRLDDVPAVVRDVAAARDGTLTESSAQSSVSVQERIDDLVDRVADGNDAATTIVAVTALQAVVLAWFAQGVVAGRIGQARAAEWGLARLRGLPARRRFAAVLLEPVLATVVGAVAGAAAGLGLAALCAPVLLGAGAPALEPLRAPVLLALAAAFAGSLVALVVASARASRVPLVDLLRRVTEPRTLSRAGAVVQAVAVIAAVVGLAAVATETEVTGPSIALLAPSLIAVLLAIVGLRVGVAVVRRRADRPARSLTELLVVRRIARTPSVLTTAVMVVLGVALAVSSTQTAVLAVRLADDRAAATLGAATVLDVRVAEDTPFVQAVRDADPGGRSAMAVQATSRGVGVGRLIALDSTRLAAVSAWDPTWSGRSTAALQRELRPTGGRSLRLTGTQLAVTLREVGAPDGEAAKTVAPADPADVDVVAVVQATDGWHRVVLGAPRDGTLTSARGALPCTDGCRLVWLGLETSATTSAPYGLGATITDVTVGDGTTARSVGAAWLHADRWRSRLGENPLPDGGPTATLGDRRDGLRVSWVDPTGSGTPSITPRDGAEPLPTVIGAATVTQPFAGVPDATVGIGLNGESIVLRVVGTAPALPRVLADGALVDLTSAGHVSNPVGTGTDHEVWVAPGAERRVTAALARNGVTVTGRHTLADAERRAERSAPVLGALVGVPTAGAALVLVLLVVAGVGAIGAGRRRDDVDVLRTSGFPRSAVRRAVLRETFLPAAAAVLLGAVAGTIATVVTAARLPLRAEAVPPLGVPVGPLTVLAVTAVTMLVLLAVSAGVAAVGADGSGRPRGSGDGAEHRRPRDGRPAP